MEEFEAVVFEKDELEYKFEYRGISRLTAFSGIFGPSGFHCTDKNNDFSFEYFSRLALLHWKNADKKTQIRKSLRNHTLPSLI